MEKEREKELVFSVEEADKYFGDITGYSGILVIEVPVGLLKKQQIPFWVKKNYDNIYFKDLVRVKEKVDFIVKMYHDKVDADTLKKMIHVAIYEVLGSEVSEKEETIPYHFAAIIRKDGIDFIGNYFDAQVKKDKVTIVLNTESKTPDGKALVAEVPIGSGETIPVPRKSILEAKDYMSEQLKELLGIREEKVEEAREETEFFEKFLRGEEQVYRFMVVFRDLNISFKEHYEGLDLSKTIKFANTLVSKTRKRLLELMEKKDIEYPLMMDLMKTVIILDVINYFHHTSIIDYAEEPFLLLDLMRKKVYLVDSGQKILIWHKE